MTDAHLAAIRDCCIRLLQMRALLRMYEKALLAEIDRARREYGFTPFAGEDGDARENRMG